MEAMHSFEEWKDFLSRNVKVAKEAGAANETIIANATRLGEFLANQVDPANREQRLLAELWKVANEEEKKSIAACITKMVSDGVKH